MLSSRILVAVLVFVDATASGAQNILATVAAAEAEGARFQRSPTPAGSKLSWAFREPFGGTAERKCVEVVPNYAAPGRSLRSGDFIMRSGFFSRVWPHTGRQYKVLWLPLHAPYEGGEPMLLRAARIGHPADSSRGRYHAATARGRVLSESGFPSVVSFPTAGQWLIVATAAHNWGCFVLRVSSVELDGLSLGPAWRAP